MTAVPVELGLSDPALLATLEPPDAGAAVAVAVAMSGPLQELTAREAESKAAKQQQQAVEAAVKAVEAVAKGAQERAVAKAVAELQKSMAAATVDK